MNMLSLESMDLCIPSCIDLLLCLSDCSTWYWVLVNTYSFSVSQFPQQFLQVFHKKYTSAHKVEDRMKCIMAAEVQLEPFEFSCLYFFGCHFLWSRTLMYYVVLLHFTFFFFSKQKLLAAHWDGALVVTEK